MNEITKNLNDVKINYDNDGPIIKQEDYSTSDNGISVYFKNIENELIKHISKADAIIGCVAWLTSKNIINELSKKYVSIIVQKEDWLRPDGDQSKHELRKLYNLLNSEDKELSRFGLPGIANQLSVGSLGAYSEAIRCVGNKNNSYTNARCHHKFVLFCKKEETNHGYPIITPYGVWTGSFNFTYNAGVSLENVIYLENKKIVNAYANEYAQVFALSEPLDWESEWCAPEYRIGT